MRWLSAVLVLAVLVVGGCSGSVPSLGGDTTHSGGGAAPQGAVASPDLTKKTVAGISFELSTNPATPSYKSPIELVVKLTKADGAALANAKVKATADMTAHAMNPVTIDLAPAGDGTYKGKAKLDMSGDWRIRVEGTVDGQPHTAEFRVTVGQ